MSTVRSWLQPSFCSSQDGTAVLENIINTVVLNFSLLFVQNNYSFIPVSNGVKRADNTLTRLTVRSRYEKRNVTLLKSFSIQYEHVCIERCKYVHTAIESQLKLGVTKKNISVVNVPPNKSGGEKA